MDEVVNEEMSYRTFNSDTAFLMRHAAQSDQVQPLPSALGEGLLQWVCRRAVAQLSHKV